MWPMTCGACCNRVRPSSPSRVRAVNDEHVVTESEPENVAVAAALDKLNGLDDAPLEEHAALFEDVRSDLRSALDAD